MATSGRIMSGRPSYFAFYFQWQLSGQSVGGNYSNINWQWGVNITGGGYLLSNALKAVNGYINGGQAFGAYTWSNISGNGDHQLRSGSWTIGHNNDGGKSFGMSSTGWIYGEGNLGNSGSWSLPTIPRGMTMNSAPNFTDEGNPSFSYSNPAGAAMNAYLENVGTSAGRNIGASGGGTYTWSLSESERSAIRANMANVSSKTCRVVVHCNLGGQDFWDWRDVTLTIVNGSPVFTDFSYRDTDAGVVAITENNQAIVQGKSTLSAVISSDNRMVAKKSASPVKYTFNFDGINTEEAYNVESITEIVGVPANAGVKSLAVRAFDSRNSYSQVIKDLTVIPYAPPVVNTTVARENGFEDQTSLLISGSFSLVEVDGVPKNTVSTSTGVRYRHREKGGTWGGWVNKTATLDSSNVNTSETLLSLDNDLEFEFEVEIIDKFGSTITSLELGKGKPILWIGANRTVAVNHKPDSTVEGLHIQPGDALWDYVYPIGAVVLRTTNTNPQAVFGGTWVATTTASASFLGQTVYGFKRTA